MSKPTRPPISPPTAAAQQHPRSGTQDPAPKIRPEIRVAAGASPSLAESAKDRSDSPAPAGRASRQATAPSLTTEKGQRKAAEALLGKGRCREPPKKPPAPVPASAPTR